MNSGTVLAGNDGFTTMTWDWRVMVATGAMSRAKLELVVKRRVDRAAWRDHEERITVRGRAHDRLGADVAAPARSVVDDKWLAQPFRQPLAHRACHGVGRPAGRKWHDPAHRPRRVGLRESDVRDDRQRGGARGH